MVERIRINEEATIDKTWRILLEAALFEGRMGNRKEARELFKYLMTECKGHGTIYLEASKYEERENLLISSIDICKSGLKVNMRFSPLWFQYLKLFEKAP